MSISEVIVMVLLAAGTAVELLSCLGLLAMRNAFDRLHYLSPAATVGPVLLGAAVLVRHSSAQACIKADSWSGCCYSSPRSDPRDGARRTHSASWTPGSPRRRTVETP